MALLTFCATKLNIERIIYMAFDATYLIPITDQANRGKASTIWSYWTLDTHATVDSADYFLAAYKKLSKGDIINVVVFTTTIATGAISTYGRHIVNSVSSTTVDVSDVTVGTVTDTD